MSRYCTPEEVKKQLPENLRVEDGGDMPTFGSRQNDTLDIDTINYYIDMASDYIDSAIGTIYDTPLKKVNRGGKIGFPKPIPYVASLLASQLIYETVLQGNDKQASDVAKEKKKQALDTLKLIQNGELTLAGIRNTRGSRFVTGTLFDVQPNPAKDSKSEGY